LKRFVLIFLTACGGDPFSEYVDSPRFDSGETFSDSGQDIVGSHPIDAGRDASVLLDAGHADVTVQADAAMPVDSSLPPVDAAMPVDSSPPIDACATPATKMCSCQGIAYEWPLNFCAVASNGSPVIDPMPAECICLNDNSCACLAKYSASLPCGCFDTSEGPVLWCPDGGAP
jgi:hypothetical protein